MKKSAFKVASLALIAMMSSFAALAQDSDDNTPKVFGGAKQFRSWSIGANVGAAAPKVVTGGQNDYPQTQLGFAYGIYVQKNFTHAFAVKADFQGVPSLQGKFDLSQEDSQRQTNPGYESFDTKVSYAFSIMPVVDLTALLLKREPRFSVYVQGGWGITGYTPSMTTTQGNPGPEENKRTEQYFPVGGGFKYKINERWAIDLGYTMNFVDADNLDGTWVAPQNDKWSYGYAGANYSIGKKDKRNLDWVNPYALMYDELKDDKLRQEVEALKERVAANGGEIEHLMHDSDGDGVSDVYDKEPNTPAGVQVDGAGRTIVFPKHTVDTVIMKDLVKEENVGTIQFEQNSAVIHPSSSSAIKAMAKEINSCGKCTVQINGYASIEGTEEYNMQLSERRAESMKQALVKESVPSTIIATRGFGTANPVASNDTEAGREKNRRVEILIVD